MIRTLVTGVCLLQTAIWIYALVAMIGVLVMRKRHDWRHSRRNTALRGIRHLGEHHYAEQKSTQHRA